MSVLFCNINDNSGYNNDGGGGGDIDGKSHNNDDDDDGATNSNAKMKSLNCLHTTTA